MASLRFPAPALLRAAAARSVARTRGSPPAAAASAKLATAGPVGASRALYQEVAERLRSAIFERQLEPGSWIDEQKLALEYGISRTPLRAALKVLAVEGLVTLAHSPSTPKAPEAAFRPTALGPRCG